MRKCIGTWRGTGSITACYAVILHEFNGHACREISTSGARRFYFTCYSATRSRPACLCTPFLPPAAIPFLPVSPLVRPRTPRATEINKRCRERAVSKASHIDSASRPKRNIRRNLIHFPSLRLSLSRSRPAPLSSSSPLPHLLPSRPRRPALHRHASLIEASPIPSWN